MSVVSVPESRAQPLTVIVSLLSSIVNEKRKNKCRHFRYLYEVICLPKYPAIFMHEVAGNSPSRPFRPPIPWIKYISIKYPHKKVFFTLESCTKGKSSEPRFKIRTYANFSRLKYQSIINNNKNERQYLQGLSRIAEEKLLWKGSSHSLLCPFIDTHLKQSIENTLK